MENLPTIGRSHYLIFHHSGRKFIVLLYRHLSVLQQTKCNDFSLHTSSSSQPGKYKYPPELLLRYAVALLHSHRISHP